MARTVVAKKSDFADLSVADLKEKLKEKGAKTSGTQEELVQRLVEYSYPVYPLPKARESSARGLVLLAYVDKDGTPKKDPVTDEEVAKLLIEKGKETEQEAALKTVRLYKHNLTRYYGYVGTTTESGTKFQKR